MVDHPGAESSCIGKIDDPVVDHSIREGGRAL